MGTCESCTDHFALHADAPAVDDADGAEAEPVGFFEVGLDDTFCVAQRDCVKVKDIGDGDSVRLTEVDGMVRHENSLYLLNQVRGFPAAVIGSQQMRKALLFAAAAMILLSGCHHHKVAKAPPPAPMPQENAGSAPETPSSAWVISTGSGEAGMASWYGHPYHGRASASGEIYDMEQMTAAHRTLPFGTMVRVHDLDNGKTVDVRINDRGPFVDGRIIDISHAAARAMEMIGPGTARVQLEILSAPPPVEPPSFGVQVGAFRNRDNAENLRRAMEAKYGRARLVQRADTPGIWHVVVGKEFSQGGASALAERIREEDHSVTTVFVVRLDSV